MWFCRLCIHRMPSERWHRSAHVLVMRRCILGAFGSRCIYDADTHCDPQRRLSKTCCCHRRKHKHYHQHNVTCITVDTVLMVTFHGEPALPRSGGQCEFNSRTNGRTRPAHRMRFPFMLPPILLAQSEEYPLDSSSLAFPTEPTNCLRPRFRRCHR